MDRGGAYSQRDVPPGFSLEPLGRDASVIRIHHPRLGCLYAFLIVWLVAWTFGCVALLRGYLGGSAVTESGDPVSLWFVLVFWVVDIGAAVLFTYWIFYTKSFHMDRRRLIVETGALGFKQRTTIRKGSIRRVAQVEEKGEDGAPTTWGLKVEADTDATLLSCHPHDESQWLGQFLSQWADVEFAEVREE